MRIILFSILTTWLISFGARAESFELKSPDRKLTVTFKNASGLFWALNYEGKTVLEPSRLAMELKDASAIDDGFKVLSSTHRHQDETWKPVYGERAVVRDLYNELVIALKDGEQRELQLTFRAYNEGVAFCYSFPEQPKWDGFTITKEHT